MSTCIVIPARRGSTRFPGKPMAKILGVTLLERVWRIARAVKAAERVVVATDDEEILAFAHSFGAEGVMTSPACRNGSERALAAVEALQIAPEIVVNLQGDAPLTPPWFIEDVIAALRSGKHGIATPAMQLTWDEYDALVRSRADARASGTFVVFGAAHEALYFSKAAIPAVRTRVGPLSPAYRHVGLYGFTLPILRRYAGLQPTPLEVAEGLEQLRALERGIPIRVVPVDRRGRSLCSIDNPSDVAEAEAIIRREGELVTKGAPS